MGSSHMGRNMMGTGAKESCAHILIFWTDSWLLLKCLHHGFTWLSMPHSSKIQKVKEYDAWHPCCHCNKSTMDLVSISTESGCLALPSWTSQHHQFAKPPKLGRDWLVLQWDGQTHSIMDHDHVFFILPPSWEIVRYWQVQSSLSQVSRLCIHGHELQSALKNTSMSEQQL